MSRRGLLLGIGLSVIVALSAIVAWRQAAERAERQQFDAALTELRAGRLAIARRMLRDLSERRPGQGAYAYHLGVVELALDRPDAALTALARVPPGTEQAGWAAVHQAGVWVKRGQLARSEALLTEALTRPGNHTAEACWELVRLLRLQGRLDEAERLFHRHFTAFADPVAALRDLYRLAIDPYAAEGVQALLATARRQCPDDDRVWLGMAHLALRAGRFDEAASWLQACHKARPDDPAVWRLELEWARSQDRPDLAPECLRHLPADEAHETLIPTLKAWFARHAGDREAERAALDAAIARNPADGPSLERLAELAIQEGDRARATDLRRRKAELVGIEARYRDGLAGSPSGPAALALARLAEALGRRFDAQVWRTLAGARPPEDLSALSVQAGSSTTLADRLAPELARLGTRCLSAASAPAGFTLRLTDEASARGLAFTHDSGASGAGLIPPVSMAGGVALLDFDGDGWLDVYAVQSGAFRDRATGPQPTDRLFRNRGDGTFEDVTAAAGLAVDRGYGHGVTVGDVDGDGDPDLFLTRWRRYVLLSNRGNGTFEDATEAWGLGGDRDWPTSAALADLDGDGDLDLYVCHYFQWDEHAERPCVDPAHPGQYACNPTDFPALPDHLFRNDGGHFTDVTASAGIVDRDGRGLGVVAADLDDDGLVDLFVANDMTANRLYHNRGGMRFEEVGHESGVASNAVGGYQAGMGVACGDLDGDGRIDLTVTNFYNESTTFYRNLGAGQFVDATASIGLAALSRHLLGFGIALPDLDSDGRLDLISANGHIHDGRPQFPWKMPLQLLRGTASGRLVDVAAATGEAFTRLHLARGLATGDLDNDGRLDVLVQPLDEPLIALRNTTPGGRSLTLVLQGTASNRDAVGAVVTIEAEGRRLVSARTGGASYQSACDSRLHFGLGDADRVDRVTVRWPWGPTESFEGVEPGGFYRLREGNARAEPLITSGPAVRPAAAATASPTTVTVDP